MFSHSIHRSYVPLAGAGALVVLLGVAGLVWAPGEPPVPIDGVIPVATDPVAPTVVGPVAIDPESTANRSAASDSKPAVAIEVAPCPIARLRVLDAHGAPIRGARVALLDASGRVVDATTDGDGFCAIDVAVGSSVFVAACNRVVDRAVCELDADAAHRIVLDDGATIAGRVELDGHAPSQCVPLTVQLGLSLGVPPGLTPALDEALGHPSRDLDSLTILPDADGTFTFAGLPRDARGQLHAKDWRRFGRTASDAASDCAVAAGATDLLVSLTRLPAVCFRVVDRAGAPIAEFPLTAELRLENDCFDWVECSTDAKGCAEVGVASVAGDGSRIAHMAVSGFKAPYGALQFESVGPWGHRINLGDMQIEPAHRLRLVVRDERRDPIAGARAFVEWNEPAGSASGSDGAIDASVRPDTSELFVAAAGFASACVEVAATADAVDVTLQRETVLRVVARAPDGAPVPGLRVQIAGPHDTFSDPFVRMSTLEGMPVAFKSAVDEGYWSGDDMLVLATTDERGEAVVRRLPAGTELACTVREAPSSEGSTSAVVLEQGVERVLDVRMPLRGWALRVRVTNEAGDVLPETGIDSYDAQGTIASAVTDASGECAMTLFSDMVTVVAGCRGFGADCVAAARTTDAGATRTIVLRPERALDVFVISARGTPIEFLRVSAAPVIDGVPRESQFVDVDWHEHGLRRVRGLGARSASITIDVGGWKTERVVDATTSALRVVLDDTGSVILPPANLGDAVWDSSYAFVGRDGREVQRFPASWFPENEAFEVSGVRSGEYDVRLVQAGDAEVLVASADRVLVTSGVATPANLVAPRRP